jgi:hypothetical protein
MKPYSITHLYMLAQMDEFYYAVAPTGAIYCMGVDEESGRMILERSSRAWGYVPHADAVEAPELLDTMRTAWATAKERHVDMPYDRIYLDEREFV